MPRIIAPPRFPCWDREAEREKVAAVVRGWRAEDLETVVVTAGGCAARMMSREEWRMHPQGAAVSKEPLASVEPGSEGARDLPFDPARPLAGIRVLDLTGFWPDPSPPASWAGFGAEVLRLDPPDWDEANVAPEVTLGKRCAMLDLKQEAGRAQFRALLSRADILCPDTAPMPLSGLASVRRSARQSGPGWWM